MTLVRVDFTIQRVNGQFTGEVKHDLGEERVISALYRHESGKWRPEKDYTEIAKDGNTLSVTLRSSRYVNVGGDDATKFKWSAVIIG